MTSYCELADRAESGMRPLLIPSAPSHRTEANKCHTKSGRKYSVHIHYTWPHTLSDQQNLTTFSDFLTWALEWSFLNLLVTRATVWDLFLDQTTFIAVGQYVRVPTTGGVRTTHRMLVNPCAPIDNSNAWRHSLYLPPSSAARHRRHAPGHRFNPDTLGICDDDSPVYAETA